MTILLTGFTPFDDLEVNPSQLVVENVVAFSRFRGLVTAMLPTEFKAAGERIRALIEKHDPSVVLMLGLSRSRSAINIERIAINIDDAAIVDNAGDFPQGRQIIEDAPPAYWSTLPVEKLHSLLQQQSIPSVLSNHAGTFVCNHIFYTALHLLADKEDVRCGFIHVPQVIEGDTPDEHGMPLKMVVDAIGICLDELSKPPIPKNTPSWMLPKD